MPLKKAITGALIRSKVIISVTYEYTYYVMNSVGSSALKTSGGCRPEQHIRPLIEGWHLDNSPF